MCKFQIEKKKAHSKFQTAQESKIQKKTAVVSNQKSKRMLKKISITFKNKVLKAWRT